MQTTIEQLERGEIVVLPDGARATVDARTCATELMGPGVAPMPVLVATEIATRSTRMIEMPEGTTIESLGVRALAAREVA